MDRHRADKAAWAALLAVYLLWGSTYLAIKVGDKALPPLVLAGVRYLAAGALLYPVARRSGGPALRTADRPGPRQLAASAVVGVLLLVCGNGGVTVAERALPSGLVAVLVATVPLFMAVLGVLLRGQRVSPAAVAGLLVGLGGVALLSGSISSSGHLGLAVLAVGAALCWALGSVIGGRLPLPRRPMLAAAIEMLCGGAVLIAAAAASGELGSVRWSAVPVSGWLALAFLVVPGSILGFTAYGFALSRLPITTVSTYAYVNPVVAILLGVTALGERLSVAEVSGAAVVLASVVLTGRRAPAGREAALAER